MSFPNSLLTRFHEYIRRHRLIETGERILVAVSGGADSRVLLDLLAKDRERLKTEIAVAHVNHQLRGSESDGDEEFVTGLARQYDVPVYVERADTAGYAASNKVGIQEAARELRYQFFDRVLLSHGFNKTATAHTADDNAETILLNLCRGAGVSGLSGIPPFNEQQRTIRPMLFAQRDDVEGYARSGGLSFRTDSSNAKDVYTRNFIRHSILPEIRKRVNPNIIASLGQTAEVLSELEAFVLSTSREKMEQVVQGSDEGWLEMSIPGLQDLPGIIRQYTIMHAVQRLSGKRLEFKQVQAVLSLLEAQTGSNIPIGNNYRVIRDRERLVFRRGESNSEFSISVRPNHDYEFPAFRFSSSLAPEREPHQGHDVEYVDAGRLSDCDLVLRNWREGDAFVPLGMSGKKKVSDFLIDEKVPVFEKHSIPVLETEAGEIVWLCGRRIDDRFKISSKTNAILKLEFKRYA